MPEVSVPRAWSLSILVMWKRLGEGNWAVRRLRRARGRVIVLDGRVVNGRRRMAKEAGTVMKEWGVWLAWGKRRGKEFMPWIEDGICFCTGNGDPFLQMGFCVS